MKFFVDYAQVSAHHPKLGLPEISVVFIAFAVVAFPTQGLKVVYLIGSMLGLWLNVIHMEGLVFGRCSTQKAFATISL